MSVKERNFATALWDFFCSLKLTIITLILLAITSIIGTVIQQNLPSQEYIRVYGETTYRVLSKLDFFDMYHSWWFLALLGLFCINLICCSIKRLPRVFKMVKNPVLVPEDTLYRTLSNVEEHVVSESMEDTRRKMETFLGNNFAAPVVTEKDGKIHFFAQKGAYARFGVYVTHLSILIIFVGAIIGTVWGFRGTMNIPEGTQTAKVWPWRGGTHTTDLPFAVRCKSFKVTFYPGTREPKKFQSVLTILKDGKPVPGYVDRSVIVNHPLTYKGYTLYQSGYGVAGAALNLKVKVRATGKTLDITARKGQPVLLPGGGVVRVAAFTNSFRDFGPAARLEIQSKTGQPRALVVLQRYPDFDAQRKGDYVFSLLGYKQRLYTGLQVSKDPGVWVVWFGCIFLVLGTICAFFLSHRRVWATIQRVGNKTGIKVGGTAHRNQPAFELFFENFKKKLKNELTV